MTPPDKGANLSEEAELDYEEKGSYEFTIPYVWEDELKRDRTPKRPHYITVGIVPDDEMEDYLDNVGYWEEDRPISVEQEVEEYVSERLGWFIEQERVLHCFNNDIKTPDELDENFDDIVLILSP